MALCYAGIEVAVREIALRDKPQALRAISPKATVPVLQLASGEVLDQSLDIMLWALRQSDPDGWLVAGDHAQAESWIALNDGPFKLLLDRYKYAQRHPELSLQAHRERALDALVYRLDAQLRFEHGHVLRHGPRRGRHASDHVHDDGRDDSGTSSGLAAGADWWGRGRRLHPYELVGRRFGALA